MSLVRSRGFKGGRYSGQVPGMCEKKSSMGGWRVLGVHMEVPGIVFVRVSVGGD